MGSGKHFVQIVAIALLIVKMSPASADPRPIDSRGISELVGTWICTEYDGLFHHYTEVTWTAEGSFVCYDSCSQSLRSGGPVTLMKRQINSDGCLSLVIVDNNDTGYSSFVIRFSRCGDHYEICQSSCSGAEGCRCFFRKKIYRGTPGYRFENRRVQFWYAGYPFKPDRVIPWTKYFWAKA
jgi:hypothetical protein